MNDQPGTDLIVTPEYQVATLVQPIAPVEDLVRAIRAYEETKRAILTKEDVQHTPQKDFIKRSGWIKLALAFGVSLEIREKIEHRDEDGALLRAEATMRAIAATGRYADGWGACSVSESRFTDDEGRPKFKARQKVDHDLPSTSMTRAANRACANLFGMGEVSAEELGQEVQDVNGDNHAQPARPSYRSPAQQANQVPQGSPKASPHKPASVNQLATITKLARLIGEPDPGEANPQMNAAQASEHITELSRLYNERKGQPRKPAEPVTEADFMPDEPFAQEPLL